MVVAVAALHMQIWKLAKLVAFKTGKSSLHLNDRDRLPEHFGGLSRGKRNPATTKANGSENRLLILLFLALQILSSVPWHYMAVLWQ